MRATVAAAGHAARAAGIDVIGLTGGVFANRLLLNGLRRSLVNSGFEVLTHRIVPVTMVVWPSARLPSRPHCWHRKGRAHVLRESRAR